MATDKAKEKVTISDHLWAFVCFNYRGPNYPASLTYSFGGSSDTQSSCTQLSDLIPAKSFFSLPEALYDFLLVFNIIAQFSRKLNQNQC